MRRSVSRPWEGHPLMTNEPKMMKVFFDEAGYTGENLDDLSQPNLLLAAIAIPDEIEQEFWSSAAKAWEIAGKYLNVSPDAVELKGADIYGQKRQFKTLSGDTRYEILDAVFTALTESNVRVFWQGVPKTMWKNELVRDGKTSDKLPFWEYVLKGYCNFLYELLVTIYPDYRFLFLGDENDCVKAGFCLMMPEDSDRWCQLVEKRIGFYQSSKVHGIQIVDVVVHTLYKANRYHPLAPDVEPPPLTAADRTAKEFHARLEEKHLWIPVSESLAKIDKLADTLSHK